jgi:hypothetical protein
MIAGMRNFTKIISQQQQKFSMNHCDLHDNIIVLKF